MDKKMNMEIDLSAVRIVEPLGKKSIGVWNDSGEEVWFGTPGQLAALIEEYYFMKQPKDNINGDGFIECPHCGGEGRENIGFEPDAGKWWQIICTVCGARTDKYLDRKQAKDAWNRHK